MPVIIKGTRGYEFFYLLEGSPIKTAPVLAPSYEFDCCNAFSWKVFCDNVGTNEFQNDKTRFFQIFPMIFLGATMTLEKNVNGNWITQTAITNNALGTFNAFGFHVNSDLQNYMQFLINWYAVNQAYGFGSYRIVTEGTLATGGIVIYTSDTYCLSLFTAEAVDQTVRIEWYNNGVIGDSFDDTIQRDFSTLNSYGQIRLSGYFAYKKSNYAKEYTLYNNNEDVWTEDSQTPEYAMNLHPTFFNAHQLMRTDIMQSDKILVTDYNSQNTYNFTKKQIQLTSDYSPTWVPIVSKLAPINLTFKQAINNFRKKRY